MPDIRTIRFRRATCSWAKGRWISYMDIGGAAGIVIGPYLITWIKY